VDKAVHFIVMTRPLRKDAALRRAALREAAAAEFAQNGLDVPLDAIADRAGVGRATLYRNFPDRSELVLAVFSDLVDALGEGMRMKGGPDAFLEFVDGLADLLLEHGGLAAALRDPRLPDARLKLREKINAAGVPALELSKAAGRVRNDLSVKDIRVITALLGAALETAAPEEREEMSRRTRAFVLDGLRGRP
jgi:AcrR family transcriptional regulator